MKKPSKIETIKDETMFSAISAEKSLEVVGGGCTATASCTFGAGGDKFTISDTFTL